MRILFVINDLAYFRAHRERLAIDASADGHEVIIAAGECNNQSKQNWNQALKLIELKLKRHRTHPLSDAILVMTLLKVIRKTKPDIVHCFTIKPILFGGIATMFARMAGYSSKLVWTFAGLGKVYESNQSIRGKIRQQFVTHVLRLVSKTATAYATFENSADQQFLISKKLVPINRSTTVMGTGIDLSIFTAENRHETNCNAPLRFLLASRLIKGKGILDYLNAAQEMKQKGYEANFLLAGTIDETNPDTVDPNDIELAHDAQIVQFLGAITQEDMPDLLQNTDVICLPTKLREGLPRSLLEAAACGAAMIASNQPAMKKIVVPQETGWLLNPADDHSLKQAMEEAISNPQTTLEYGKNARQNLEKLPVSSDDIWAEFKHIYSS